MFYILIVLSVYATIEIIKDKYPSSWRNFVTSIKLPHLRKSYKPKVRKDIGKKYQRHNRKR